MARKIWDKGFEEIEKIEDKEARLQALEKLLFQPTIDCLNDLDERLRKLEEKLKASNCNSKIPVHTS